MNDLVFGQLPFHFNNNRIEKDYRNRKYDHANIHPIVKAYTLVSTTNH